MTLYQRLARRLDRIPNGYPRTESGVEIRILEKLFTPRQAEIACVMQLRAQAPERIARRLNSSAEALRPELDQMVQDGLIRVEKASESPVYGLVPFVVGIYELNLHRMDTEFAQMMETYVQELGGENALFVKPAVHRVIPVETAIPSEIQVHSHESASAMLEAAQSWGVRDCICRVQRNLIGKGCDHPVEICLVYAHETGAFKHAPATRPIEKAEALALLDQAREAGLVHSTGNYRNGTHYICNCCTCSCGVLRGLAEFQIPTAIARAEFVAVVDEALCEGCGECLNYCQFDAIDLPMGTAQIDALRCLGCGQCAHHCEQKAVQLHRREGRPADSMPGSMVEWMLRRGVQRGPGFLEVL